MTNAEVIETLRANYPDACYEQLREAVDAAIEALKAQDVAGDTISRQAAIDALSHMCSEDENGITVSRANVNSMLRALPPAQPEIIRCKDCRWGKEVCGNIECFVDANVPPEYHGYDWFCPNGERRTDETD